MLNEEEIQRVREGIAVLLGVPFNATVGGAAWENVFAYGVGGTVAGTGGGGEEEQGSKLLFDVVRGTTGWSCKTLMMRGSAERGPRGQEYEFVIKRSDVLSKYGLEMRDPDELGRHIISDRNEEYTRSARAQGIEDPRIGILLRTRAQRHFAYWEEDYGLFDFDAYEWDWGSPQQKSVFARQRSDGLLKLKWYRSGTQLFERFRVPESALLFEVNWRAWPLEQLRELYDFLYG